MLLIINNLIMFSLKINNSVVSFWKYPSNVLNNYLSKFLGGLVSIVEVYGFNVF